MEIHIIEFVAGLLLYISKYLLRIESKYGWIPGIFGTALLQYVVWGVPEMIVSWMYHWGLLGLSVYGFLIDWDFASKKTSRPLKIALAVITMLLCVGEYFVSTTAHWYDSVQLIMTFIGLFGTMLLAIKMKLYGFWLYFCAHILSIVAFGFGPHLYVSVVIFQILSLHQAWLAIRGEYRKIYAERV